jgi:flap endonuclease-1
MGVNLTPIIKKQMLTLKDLAGKSLAIDANNALHQFLSITRMADGSPFTDGQGNVTSHLIGLLFRSTRLISEFAVRPIYVFDGEPPALKRREIEKRRAVRAKAESEMAEALRRGDLHTAFSKAVMTGRLTREMIDDAKRLLHLLGIPYVQAPSEAEAQAAHMASHGHVWAANSQDYDSILFGTPRLIRYVTIQGKEYLPSKGKTRPLKPELIELEDLLASLGVSREQIVDIAILIGTDFNEGVRGIGPKTALKLIREHGSIENLPDNTRSRVSEDFRKVREVFLNPQVTLDFSTRFGPLREKELCDFLCLQKSFSRNRVELAVERMRKSNTQSILLQWTERN